MDNVAPRKTRPSVAFTHSAMPQFNGKTTCFIVVFWLLVESIWGCGVHLLMFSYTGQWRTSNILQCNCSFQGIDTLRHCSTIIGFRVFRMQCFAIWALTWILSVFHSFTERRCWTNLSNVLPVYKCGVSVLLYLLRSNLKSVVCSDFAEFQLTNLKKDGF